MAGKMLNSGLATNKICNFLTYQSISNDYAIDNVLKYILFPNMQQTMKAISEIYTSASKV